MYVMSYGTGDSGRSGWERSWWLETDRDAMWKKLRYSVYLVGIGKGIRYKGKGVKKERKKKRER